MHAWRTREGAAGSGQGAGKAAEAGNSRCGPEGGSGTGWERNRLMEQGAWHGRGHGGENTAVDVVESVSLFSSIQEGPAASEESEPSGKRGGSGGWI